MARRQITPEMYSLLYLALEEDSDDFDTAGELSGVDPRTARKAFLEGFPSYGFPAIKEVLEGNDVLPPELTKTIIEISAAQAHQKPEESQETPQLNSGQSEAEQEVIEAEEQEYLAERRVVIKAQQEERQIRTSSRTVALGSLAVSLRLLNVGTKVAHELDKRSLNLGSNTTRELQSMLSMTSSFAEKALKISQGAVGLEKNAVLRPDKSYNEEDMDEETAQETLKKIQSDLQSLIAKKNEVVETEEEPNAF